MILKLLLIAVGGALGAVLRYLLAGLVHGGYARVGGGAAVMFPIGTLAVNAAGCLAIGIVGTMFLSPSTGMREEYRLAVLVGLLGGFTTFSTFGFETIELFRAGHANRAMLNILLMNTICLAAVYIGYRIADRFALG